MAYQHEMYSNNSFGPDLLRGDYSEYSGGDVVPAPNSQVWSQIRTDRPSDNDKYVEVSDILEITEADLLKLTPKDIPHARRLMALAKRLGVVVADEPEPLL